MPRLPAVCSGVFAATLKLIQNMLDQGGNAVRSCERTARFISREHSSTVGQKFMTANLSSQPERSGAERPAFIRFGKIGTTLAAVLVMLCGLGILAPKAAWAHAELVASRPAANSTVKGPDVTILLRYDSRVDATRSTVTLLGPQGKIRKVAVSAQSAPNQLSAQVKGLTAKGAYMLRWQALASDGHITRGEVPFRVQ